MYSSLSTNKPNGLIRVLRVLSSHGEAINCKLEIIDLDSSNVPKYSCLSYTWDKPLYEEHLSKRAKWLTRTCSNTPTISINEEILKIGTNLHEALLKMRENGVVSDKNLIWIDAVCINQDDMKERSEQVAKMSKVYQRAERVVVWLGPEDFDPSTTARGIEMMKRLAIVKEKNLDVNIPNHPRHDQGYEKLGLEPINHGDRVALGTFFRRRYFGRVWILQEIFAARDILVLCGGHLLSWSDISMAARTLRGTRIGKILDGEMDVAASASEEKEKSCIVSNQSYFEALRVSKQNNQRPSLETLLMYSQSCGATDPRDYVFAILGIWKHFLESDDELAGFILPDYVADIKTAFTKATIACMIESGNLNILSGIEDSSFYSESKDKNGLPILLPSWVQDFTIPRKSHPLKEVLSLVDDQRHWNMGAGMEWDISPLKSCLRTENEDIFVLPVEGTKIDSIEEISTSDDEIVLDRDFYTFLAILQNHINSTSPSNISSSIESFCRALLAIPSKSPTDLHKTQKAFRLLITMWVWELEIDLERCEDPEDLEDFSETYLQTKLLMADLSNIDTTETIPTWTEIQDLIRVSKEEYDDEFPNHLSEAHDEISKRFKHVFLGRRMFRTEDNFLGIGPRSMEDGDQVWAIAGAEMPMILRPLGAGAWKLIGETYVHGLSEGKANSTVGNVKERIMLR